MPDENHLEQTFSDSSINVADLIDHNYVVICDTNVYLGLYRFSPDYANFALECLNSVQTKIILPYTVKVEYLRHYQSLFRKRQGTIENSISDTMDLINKQNKSLRNSCATLTTRHFPEADELLIKIDEKYNTLKTMLTDYFDEHSVLTLIRDSWTGDPVSSFVQGLITNTQLANDFSREDIYDICEEGENRYKREIPPGYKDGKQKDGIRKYSDLILWKEVIRYAKQKQTNIIFVTDDVKPDWWNIDNGRYEFLPQLVKEFEKNTKIRASQNEGDCGSPMKIVPFISTDFYDAVSSSMGIEKSDIIDQALRITDEDYITDIESDAFDSISETLKYSGFEYVDESTLTYICSEGIDEWDIEDYELETFSMVDRDDDQISYELVYNVQMCGNSYDYWGRDEESHEEILSPAYRYGVEGQLKILVTRTVNILMDFESSNDFDSAKIISGDFHETEYHSFDTDQEEVPDAYDTCPDCGRPINHENDGGDGFCIDCSPNH